MASLRFLYSELPLRQHKDFKSVPGRLAGFGNIRRANYLTRDCPVSGPVNGAMYRAYGAAQLVAS